MGKRGAQTLVVFLGGAVGTLIRALIEAAWPSVGWPWATFTINLTGSFLLGLLLTALVRSGGDAGWRNLVRLGAGTGLLGGYTTYSTFILEGDLLVSSGRVAMAVAYLAGSVLLGALAAVAGVLLARRLVAVAPDAAR
ncbi:MAG TPA: CrcB family protein [Arachnia sp.]|nr:CrcB family protein [Arachnia sp.]HMT86155.1 CrcB family protein [Arachnia sp.]